MASTTIVGVFDGHDQARDAVARLEAAGFVREAIRIERGAGDGIAAEEGGALRSVVVELFGIGAGSTHGAERSGRIGDALRRRGGTVVAVQAQDETEARVASDLLERCGAIGMERWTTVPGGNMETTQIVGVFDDATEARLAAQRLELAGLAPEAMRMKGGDGSTIPGPSEGGSIRNFFANLFGSDDEQPDDFPGDYAEAVRRGATVLLVEAGDDATIERVIEVLDESGAIDIDERIAAWRQGGYVGHDETAAPYSDEERAAERARYDPGGAPIADEQREASAQRRSHVRVYRRAGVETAYAKDAEVFDELQERLDEVRAERASLPPGVHAAEEREMAMAARGLDRPSQGNPVGGSDATGAVWSAAPGQQRQTNEQRGQATERRQATEQRQVERRQPGRPYDGPERRGTRDLPYTDIERRGPAQ